MCRSGARFRGCSKCELWVVSELSMSFLLDFAKSEWCYLTFVAVFSSHGSIFRTPVSTAAWTDSWGILPGGYLCARVCAQQHLHGSHTWMQRHGRGFVNDLCVECRQRQWMATVCEWKQKSMYACLRTQQIAGYTGVRRRGATNTPMNTKRSNKLTLTALNANRSLQENNRSSGLISAFSCRDKDINSGGSVIMCRLIKSASVQE